MLHSFAFGADGSGPLAGVIMDAQGNLYGTTYAGGVDNYGTFFSINPKGKETVFTMERVAQRPHSDLIANDAGNFLGTAENGSVYEVTPDGNASLLYSIGGTPRASLVRNKKGDMFTTTYQGGSMEYGTVYEFPHKGFEIKLYSFQGGADGAYPSGNVALDHLGNIYGTTSRGGNFDLGTVFRLKPNGTHTVLHSFKGGRDGAFPITNLVMDNAGSIYGTTMNGGAHSYGTVFKLTVQ